MCLKNSKYKKLSWVLKPSLTFLAIIFFIIFDRFLKSLTIKGLFNNSIEIINNIFRFNFAANENIAFSLPVSGWWLNILISLIIIALIYNLLYYAKKQDYYKACLLFAIILGAISNLLDRFKYGYVIDYFDLKYFTVFNLADVMIVAGVIGLGWLIIRKKDSYKKPS